MQYYFQCIFGYYSYTFIVMVVVITMKASAIGMVFCTEHKTCQRCVSHSYERKKYRNKNRRGTSAVT